MWGVSLPCITMTQKACHPPRKQNWNNGMLTKFKEMSSLISKRNWKNIANQMWTQ